MASSTVSSESVARQERRGPCGIDPYPSAVSSKHVERQERGDPCSSEISEEQLLTKPTKNPKPKKNVDHDQERRDLYHSDIPEWLQEFKENCEIFQRTKITRAPCRRRNSGAVPRAENFGDLITADHKDLSENCESRNNHRYAIAVQDLATQWIQSYRCKTKLRRKHKGACKSSWS